MLIERWVPSTNNLLRNDRRNLYPVLGLIFLLVGCEPETTADTATVSATPPVTETQPSALPDFAAIPDVKTKKSRFFDYLHKRIVVTNDNIWAERQFVLDFQERYNQSEATDDQTKEFAKLVDKYKMELPDVLDQGFFDQLLMRVDVVPASLVLAQGANESAWGTSRFARKGNNLFGIWCYTEGCGLKPAAAAAGSKHEVRKFKTVQAGVTFYAHNINIGHAYDSLRKQRAELRSKDKALTGIQLADGLTRYSERGAEYVSEIKSMIRYNELAQYNRTRN